MLPASLKTLAHCEGIWGISVLMYCVEHSRVNLLAGLVLNLLL